MRWVPPALWGKIVIVHCGLNSTYLETVIVPPASNPRLVCVGRFDQRKAQILLVAAARQLHLDGMRFELVLVGD